MYHFKKETNGFGDTLVDVYCCGKDLSKILIAMQRGGYDTLSVNIIPECLIGLNGDWELHIVFVKDVDKRYNKLNLTRYEREDILKEFNYLLNKNV